MRETTDANVARSGLTRLLGQGESALCVDGVERPYVDLDAAASTAALVEVAAAVNDFLPGYASIHRGAGWRSRTSTAVYEQARQAILASPAGSAPTTWLSSVATPPKPEQVAPSI